MDENSIPKENRMRHAFALAMQGVEGDHGGPFGAVVVRGNEIIGQGYNNVLTSYDPTAHAEIVAIRQATRTLKNYWLEDCEIYCTCEPCPMCLSAIYWARIPIVYYAASRFDAEKIGFQDNFIYEELGKNFENRKVVMKVLLAEEVKPIFDAWIAKTNKIIY